MNVFISNTSQHFLFRLFSLKLSRNLVYSYIRVMANKCYNSLIKMYRNIRIFDYYSFIWIMEMYQFRNICIFYTKSKIKCNIISLIASLVTVNNMLVITYTKVILYTLTKCIIYLHFIVLYTIEMSPLFMCNKL